ncbi:GNAT family N-acetyltransferase [Gordonia sp. NPDC058843]|uniref:N-acetylglutamate synthase, CG3035 family n=1 Tax=Gordonia sp. NPDC058843 TaxID=3346648 RepID=UPI0036BC2663
MEVSVSGAVVGDRIVVRYLLGDSTPADWRGNPAAAQSDVTGILVDDSDPLRIRRDAEELSIPFATITSVRLLSAKPVRNSEIRGLEHAAAVAWPGIDTEWIDGWFLRAGHGFSRRANSAVPLDRHARPDAPTLQRIADWYAARNLPPLLALPERLIPLNAVSGTSDVEVQMLTSDLPALRSRVQTLSHTVHIAPSPDSGWVNAYVAGRETRATEAATEVVTAGTGPLAFATVGDAEAIGRGSVTQAPDGHRWLGLTALWTDPIKRGGGLSSAVVAALTAWGVEHGADSVYLQVESTNRLAGSWYRRLGFGLHHTYRYLTPDLPTASGAS